MGKTVKNIRERNLRSREAVKLLEQAGANVVKKTSNTTIYELRGDTVSVPTGSRGKNLNAPTKKAIDQILQLTRS